MKRSSPLSGWFRYPALFIVMFVVLGGWIGLRNSRGPDRADARRVSDPVERTSTAQSSGKATATSRQASQNPSDQAFALPPDFMRMVQMELRRTRKQLEARARFENGPQTWEGKPKGELTDEERQIIGATPIGYYISKQHPRWTMVQMALEAQGYSELGDRVQTLRRQFFEASLPYAKYEVEQLLATQRELLEEIRGASNFRFDFFDIEQIAEINEEFAADEQTLVASKNEVETWDE